jgi:NAD(P)H-flavin reductase
VRCKAPHPRGPSRTVTVGPPIMINFLLKELGFAPEQIITTLEGKMKCGRGSVGDQSICTDGPVFRHDQIQRLLPHVQAGRGRRAMRGAGGE